MDKRRENLFWDVISILDELNILQYTIIMGSFAEYLYEDIFKNEYVGPSTTKDIDLMYNNIRKPDRNICLINKLKEKGFVYLEDPVTGTSKFYKDGDVELEFLTKRLGKGENLQQNIIPLGIKADSMRDINILDLPYVIEKNNYIINVPEPAVFVIQKILINEHRVPEFKRSKDIDSVKKLLPCILHSKEHKQKFIEIYNNLSKKQKIIFHRVCENQSINIDFLVEMKKENLNENSNMIDDLSEDIENTDFDDYDD